MTMVPSADCLNVYYQDGAYRCLPGPIATGPSLGSQALNAFPWYDNTQAVALLFAGTSGGISQLEDGIWSPVGVENSISVSPASWNLRLALDGLTSVYPWKLATTLGSISVSGGLIYSGTLFAGASGNITGFISGTCGSMSPASDNNGNAIYALQYAFRTIPTAHYTTSFSISATVSATYFSSIVFSSIGTTLYATNAAFGTSGGQSTWTWGGALSIASGGNYPVKINH